MFLLLFFICTVSAETIYKLTRDEGVTIADHEHSITKTKWDVQESTYYKVKTDAPILPMIENLTQPVDYVDILHPLRGRKEMLRKKIDAKKENLIRQRYRQLVQRNSLKAKKQGKKEKKKLLKDKKTKKKKLQQQNNKPDKAVSKSTSSSAAPPTPANALRIDSEEVSEPTPTFVV